MNAADGAVELEADAEELGDVDEVEPPPPHPVIVRIPTAIAEARMKRKGYMAPPFPIAIPSAPLLIVDGFSRRRLTSRQPKDGGKVRMQQVSA